MQRSQFLYLLPLLICLVSLLPSEVTVTFEDKTELLQWNELLNGSDSNALRKIPETKTAGLPVIRSSANRSRVHARLKAITGFRSEFWVRFYFRLELTAQLRPE